MTGRRGMIQSHSGTNFIKIHAVANVANRNSVNADGRMTKVSHEQTQTTRVTVEAGQAPGGHWQAQQTLVALSHSAVCGDERV